MIPIRLSIRNFMCYREPPVLDLGPIQIACLCGPNGHGKSALLDAITWALWGQTRARTQNELIHQGQTEMSVELDFTSRDRNYRVSRRHSLRHRGQGATILELQVASGDDMVPITGNTVRETEAAIRDLIHMDYDTFVNTAFLLQGRADMFTAASPARRKQVLAEVLDLGYYESLAARAKNAGRELDRQIASLDAAIETRAAETARRPEYEAALDEQKGAMRRTLASLKEQGAAAEELRARTSHLQARRSELSAVQARLDANRAELASLKRRHAASSARLADHEAMIARSAEINAGFQGHEEAAAQVAAFGQSLADLTELERIKATAERDLAVRKERLNSDLRGEKERLNDLLRISETLPQLREDTASIAQERKAAEGIEGDVVARRAALSELNAEAQVLNSQCQQLRSQMEETRRRFDLLESGDAVCPVCRQSLDDQGADHLRDEYQKAGLAAKRRHGELQSRMEEVSRETQQRGRDIQAAESRAAAARQLALRHQTDNERALEAALAAEGRIPEVRSSIGSLEGQLAALDEEMGGELAEIDARIGELGYDGELHREASARLAELEPYSALHIELGRARADMPAEREARDLASTMVARRTTEIEDAEQELETIRAEIADLPGLEAELAAKLAGIDELESQREGLAGRIGGLKEAVARCERLEAEVAESRRRRLAVAADLSAYSELARAFGKNGIQAMVIETAIPQITSSASEQLMRLTDGGMTVKLELREGRRERGTGEPAEQLDIRVGDENGNTRSYEMFSGGEAFRINFAIRIALSRLLASRSGAPLPILFIDEGFGSQDASGQDRLREAINSIQDEFQKVLVITHIEAIKESFPVRIEVQKTPSGSTFTVN